MWQPRDGGALRPFVVLDLAKDPPRTAFPGRVEAPDPKSAPSLDMGPDGAMTIHLGVYRQRHWYVVVMAGEDGVTPPEGRVREDIMFLAGECAGLLFLRDFAEGAGV